MIIRIEQGWSPDCESEPATDQEWGVLKTSAITWAGFDIRENKRLPAHLRPRPELRIKRGDVLMTRAGPNSRVGVVALVDVDPGQLMLSDKVYRLIPGGDVSSEFVALALSSAATQHDLDSYKTGLAESQTNISQEIVRKLIIPVPQKPEREIFSKRSNAIQGLLCAARQQHEKLDRIKRGLMYDLLTGRVRVKVPEGAAL